MRTMVKYSTVKRKQTRFSLRLGVFGGVKHEDVHCIDTRIGNDHIQNAIPRKVHSILSLYGKLAYCPPGRFVFMFFV